MTDIDSNVRHYLLTSSIVSRYWPHAIIYKRYRHPMIIFREKWLWALCLAILVHVGFFFIFYMNVNKEDSLPVTNSRIDMVKPSVTPDIIDDLPPTIAKTYTAPDKNVNTVSSNDTTETPSTTQKNPITSAQTDDISAAQTLTEDSGLTSTKSASTLKARPKKSSRQVPIQMRCLRLYHRTISRR